AEQPPRAGPALFKRQLENHARIDGHGDPGVVLHLAFELPGLPARVAEGDERIGGSFATRHRGEHVARGRDLYGLGDPMGMVPLATGSVQYEAAVGVYR